MEILKNKSKISTVAFVLMLTFAATLVALPSVSAHDPPWEITCYAYMIAAPNPVGVGQNTYISMWVDASFPIADIFNDIRRTGYKLTITKPDGAIETKEWPIIYDTTGVAFTSYIPDQVGTYTLKFDYAGQVYTWNATKAMRTWTNDKFLPASRTITLTVQEEPLPDPITSYPLPTEYWTRPIEGQNTYWWTISSHWLGGNYLGTHQVCGGYELWQKDGVAPESPHIMWTKPIEFGGVVGGSTEIPGATYYSGGSYEGRFANSIIMHGRLYFQLPLGHTGGGRAGGGGYICVDLRTGEEIWYRDDIGVTGRNSAPSKGQLYLFDSPNQHGVVGGILWQVVGATWIAYDAFTGNWMYNLTNVPSGVEVYTSKGEIVRYVLNYEGRWLALWNNTAALGLRGTRYLVNAWRPWGEVVDASTAYSWNVTIPDLHGLSAPAIVAVLPGDIILGRSSAIAPGVFRYPRGTPDPYTVWAISDKPETRGQLLWIRNYTAPAGDISRQLGPVDPVNRVWTMNEAETMQWLGYSLDNGDLLWGPTTTEMRDLQFFGGGEGAGQRGVTAYGNLYVQGFGGELFCYNTEDGTLLWKYNNTYSGLQTPWDLMPILIAAAADGKVYAFNNEHSPNSPYYKGYGVYCIDAFTGEEIYTMLGWAGQVGGRGLSTSVLADGFLAYYNYYDNQIYCIGKGPSAIEVSASPKIVANGASVLIEGRVTDQSSGAKGTPAIADEFMSEWMEYLYMQKPAPMDIHGVDVLLQAMSSNGTITDIGWVTSDGYGCFSHKWTPPDEDTYTVMAIFMGSKSYWASYAQTGLGVEAAPEEPPAVEEPAYTTIDLVIIAAVVVAIIVGLYSIVTVRKLRK